ncbi:tol-pal system protein YbgF [Granulicella rosea]|uniref:Tol-pal system protein YbgF n=1 Tax=Granulicella rosea TaxID=474952 RepID=A0A239J7N4_9BACT|nr:tetratricopeptide repeat protein [Granulicella rosea]SNT01877.1 tol-pal system protein YbgF [Granulicella rosea]
MNSSRLRNTLLFAAIAFSPLAATPAFAVSKDMIQLQTQIQQLQDAIARLQQTQDENMGLIKNLVQQNSDSVNRMTATVDSVQKQLAGQQNAEGTKVDQISGQVQSLNDTLDEIKARMARLEKLMQDIQGQQQSLAAAAMQSMPQSGGAPAAQSAPIPEIAPQPTVDQPRKGKPAPIVQQAPPLAAAAAAPVEDLYKAALSDYMAAKYALAYSEFGDVAKSYPDNNLAGNAHYYMGEIDYRGAKYAVAAKDYDQVIEQFPDNNKVPASHLHKGQALIALKQNEAGIRELRSLIQRFPNSPEAMQARSKLSGMGVPVKPRAQ